MGNLIYSFTESRGQALLHPHLMPEETEAQKGEVYHPRPLTEKETDESQEPGGPAEVGIF